DVPDHPLIRFVSCPVGLTLGEKRNFACEHALGVVIAHWDSDDWYGPSHLAHLHHLLVSSGKAVVGYDSILFLSEDGRGAWRYRTIRPGVMTGNSMMYHRSFWVRHRFPSVSC